MQGSTSHANSWSRRGLCGSRDLGSVFIQDSFMGSQPMEVGSTYTMPTRDTVAGDATARSCTSKIMFMLLDICWNAMEWNGMEDGSRRRK